MPGLRNWAGRALLGLPAPIRSLRRVPVLGAILHYVSRRVLDSDEKVWTRVHAGAAAGLWFELNPRTGHNYMRGEVEPAVQSALTRFVSDGMVVYDLGANIGFFSLLAARLVGKSGKVFSFEPDPVSASRLRRNVERNGFSNVTVIEAGIWSASGVVNFIPADRSSPDHGIGHFAKDESEREGIHIRCVALDDLIDKVALPDLIKCDVEGAEVEVFLGAEKLIALRHPTIVCEMHSETNRSTLKERLVSLGYAFEAMDETHLIFLVEK